MRSKQYFLDLTDIKFLVINKIDDILDNSEEFSKEEALRKISELREELLML